VVEMPLHNQWVYLIQKNGSSSLRIQQSRDNLAVFTNDEISALDYVDVYIRNPRARYVSGVNTYLQHLQRDHPELDYSTAFWFARRYKFLNTALLAAISLVGKSQPIFAQLMQRYVLEILKILTILTNLNLDLVDAKLLDHLQNLLKRLFKDDTNIELWLFLDQILLDLAGARNDLD
jgi:hypothetical protein